MRFFLSILIGVLSTGSVLSIAGYYLSLNSSSGGGGNFISFSNPEYLLAITGAIVGIIIGGVSSLVIVGFQLNLLKAILFGFILNLLLSIALTIITQESWTNKYMRCTFFALVVSGMIINAFISLIFTSRNHIQI